METDKDRDRMLSVARTAMLYDLRLMITRDEKEIYTKEEITAFLDKVADTKPWE